MGTKTMQLSTCDFCGFEEIHEINKPRGVAVMVGSDQNGHPDTDRYLCAPCAWMVANKMGYATDKAKPPR
jgi:hypothetical protein